MKQLEGHNDKLNPEAMVLSMTFEAQDRDWQYASSTIMFLDEHINSSFAVIVAIRQGQSFFPVGMGKMVNILPKPGNVTLDEWEGECKGRKIDWYGTQEKEVQLNKLPHDSGTDSPLTIKATITKEEILSQWMDVLDIEMRRDAPSVVVDSTTKRDKFNVLSFLKYESQRPMSF